MSIKIGGDGTMYAVIETGGKQYKVSEGDKVHFEKLSGEIGDIIELDRILMVCNNENVYVGKPVLENAKVIGEIVENGKEKKIIVFKSKRRKGYRRKRGHRQQYTGVCIKEIKV